MLTRLKVTGFKNLIDMDLRFGPFTCITGANAVGKSNLFDAIAFLSALADTSLMDAAKSVRGDGERVMEIRSIFHRTGNHFSDEMAFDAEMIVPDLGRDDLGMEVKAKITFLRYRVVIGFKPDPRLGSGCLELLYEDLSHINLGSAPQNLLFPHKASTWRYSAVKGRRSGGAFISTEGEGKTRIIELHADGEAGGRPRTLLASNLQRTVLSTVNTGETPTVLMAKREMQSWRQLRLQPSALRMPDELTAPTLLGRDGEHLAALLYHLRRLEKETDQRSGNRENRADSTPSRIYSRLAGLLTQFGGEVQDIRVDRDDKRELLSLTLTGANGVQFPARSLSDGLLRFLALAVIALDKRTPGLICLEEPENGIAAERIPLVMDILLEISADVQRAVGPDNPLRQVIIISYSPLVSSLVPDESLLYAEHVDIARGETVCRTVRFPCLPGTWREKAPGNSYTVERDRIFPLPISPSQRIEESIEVEKRRSRGENGKRMEISEQIQPALPYGDEM